MWLQFQPKDSFATWEELAQAFSKKYFPPSKIAKCRNDIMTFAQMDHESLYEAWERFKELLRKCPHHEVLKWLQLQTFYLGLQSNTKAMIDAASEGSINNKTIDEAYELIDTMASNNYSDRTSTKKNVGMFAVDQTTALAAQMSSIQQQLSQMMGAMNAPVKNCNFCGGGGHQSQDCQEGNPFASNRTCKLHAKLPKGQEISTKINIIILTGGIVRIYLGVTITRSSRNNINSSHN